MAKRKRLTPALNVPSGDAAAPLETKARDGWVGYGTRRDNAPIADVAGSAATAAALDELASEIQNARSEGRLIVSAPLDQIDETYLVRDRAALDPEEMATLMASLRERGQQTPIEVVDMGEGRYGLISGWRRLTALKALRDEVGDGDFGHVQCLIRTPEAASDAYVAMVEENEIRAQLSFYERARIAVRAAEQGAFDSPRAAAKALFHAVPRAKRSKIYSFLNVYAAFDDVLKHPSALSEKLGLQLAKVAEGDADSLARIKSRLHNAPVASASDEINLITELVSNSPKKPDLKPRAPVADPVAGVVITKSGGKLVLSGDGITDGFEDKLRVWVAKNIV